MRRMQRRLQTSFATCWMRSLAVDRGDAQLPGKRTILEPRHHLGRSIADGTRAATLTAYAPGEVLGAHEHATAHVCLLLSGDYAQWAGGREVHLRAGDAGIYPLGDKHRNRMGPHGAACLNLHVPDALAPRDFTIARVPMPLRLAAADLAFSLATGRPVDALSVECLVAELVGLSQDDGPTCDVPVAKVIEALEEQPGLTLRQLADLVDRHPTHLARAFRRATGLSIGAWRRRLRVRNLCLDLRTDDASLVELSVRHGFSDQAHMSRELKAFTGITPSAWRHGR